MSQPLLKFPILIQDESEKDIEPILEGSRGEPGAVATSPRVRFLNGFLKPSLHEHDAKEFDLGAILTSVTAVREQRYVPPAVWKQEPEPLREAFLALQRWEGIVTECGGVSFIARLTDLTAEGPAEEVELSLEDVPREDLPLVEVGAVFYWSIGYRDDASGQRWRASTLRFRRLPVWSESELKAAQERSLEVAEVFGGD